MDKKESLPPETKSAIGKQIHTVLAGLSSNS
jgi:hypothetical protein